MNEYFDGDLPEFVKIEDETYYIRNKCDYRVVRDAIRAIRDHTLPENNRTQCALIIFYEDFNKIKKEHIEEAAKKMLSIISYNTEINENIDEENNFPEIMDWDFDRQLIAPPINRILGYDIRTPGKYTHWWSFIGAYNEIGGDCAFANIVRIRYKIAKKKKLEKHEKEFYIENKKIIDLPREKEEYDNFDDDDILVKLAKERKNNS